MSILEDLFFGRISPWEQKPTQSSERTAVNRKIEEEKRYFLSKMSLDDCQRFQALENLYSQASTYEEIDVFSHGFKLATILMCAVFDKDDETPYSE